MDNPDLSLLEAVPETHAVAEHVNAEHRLAYDAAFDVLRIDLVEIRGDADPELYGRAIFVLGRLDEMRGLYQSLIDAEQGGYVPAGTSSWTLADEMTILRHLAAIIHHQNLSKAAFGDEHALRKFWEYGHLPSVESMCHDARRDPVTARSDEVNWLTENWAMRHVSGAADMTSLRPASPRRTVPRADPEPVYQDARSATAAAEDGLYRHRDFDDD